MSDINTKQIELAARQYANKTQSMINYKHDFNTAYDAYLQGAKDVLLPKTERCMYCEKSLNKYEAIILCKDCTE